MADKPNALAGLLAELQSAKSPVARLRVVTRAWRAVRSLPPQDRLAVAAQIGMDGADDLVEAIAAHQGTKPPVELMSALNQLHKVDPGVLRSLVDRVRDPRQRGKVLAEGLKAVEAALIGPEPSPAPSRPSAASPEAPWLPRNLPSPTPPPAAVVSPAPAAPPAAVTPAPAPVVAMPAPSWPLREAAPPAPRPVSPPPAASPVQPAPAAAAAPRPAPAPVAVRPAEARERAEAVPAARAAIAERLSAAPLTARFRLLRRRLDELRRLSAAEIRSALETFPDGWARRRALTELLEAGVPERTPDALALIEALQSPGDRAWCLGSLADRRSLTDEEKTTLLQAAATPAGRRRLELRLGER